MDPIGFIIAYFTSKNLSMITAFLCWEPEQILELWRGAGEAGLLLNVQPNFQRSSTLRADGIVREGMLIDLSCTDVAGVLQEASVIRAFNYRNSWLLLANTTYDRDVVSDTLAPYSILPDADVIWSAPDNLVDVYRVKPNQPYLQTVLGLDRNSSAEDLKALWGALPTAVTRRKDLHGVYLKAAVVLTQPQHFKGWSELRDRQIDTYPKVTYPLVLLASEDLHFRMNMVQVDLYGVNRNGSFDGLAGLLQRGQVELGVASMFMRSDRMHVLHYFSETVTSTSAFIFRQPSRSTVSNVFLLPFTGGVWAGSGAVALLAAGALPAVRRVHARARIARPDPGLALLTVPESCTFALATLCQQGFHVTPAATSIRLVMFSTLLSSLFLFTAYSAKIVAILQTPSDAIRTLEDLTRSPLTLGVQETTYKKVYFAESTNPATQQLYRRKVQPQGELAYCSVVDGVARLRTGLFAFQVESSSGYDIITQTFTEREKCSLQEIEAFKVPRVAVPLRTHSGYRELLATRLRWQREVGLMQQTRRRWMCDKPRCEGGGGGFVTVGLIDVQPAFQVLGVGAVLALVLLIIEISTHAAINKRSIWRACRRPRDDVSSLK